MQTWRDKNYKTKIGIGIDEIMNQKQLPEMQNICFSLKEWLESCSLQELT